MGLKFKIFIGYAMLILLLGFVIYLFRGERVKRDELKREMKELGMMRELTRKAYGCLLELSSQGEVASIWSESDLQLYRKKREKTCDVLKELRQFVHMPEQQERIDSVCLLLEQKEMLLSAAMSTFDEQESIGETVGEKVPAIVRQVRRQPARNISAAAVKEVHAGKEVTGEESPEKKKSFLKRVFSGKEKKSAYRQQREQQRAAEKKIPLPTTQNSGNAVAVHLLHSLNREVSEKQKEQRKKLSAQMDSLHFSSQALNKRLNGLVGDFDKAAGERLETRYNAIVTDREASYNVAEMLALFVFLLAIVLYAILHRDVNRRLRYRRELETSDLKNKELLQSRKNMMLTIAHDLRAPLAAIRGYAELLPGEADGKRTNEYAVHIVRSSDYMIGLVNSLIEFYLLDAGKGKMNVTVFRPLSLFDEIVKLHTPSVRKEGLALCTDFEGLDTVVEGDRPRIMQIANNLLSNAIKFTRKGKISLQAAYGQGELRFSVQDTGPGMTEDEQKRIFRAFERLDNARHLPGFGLGLAVVSRLTELLDGHVTVESRSGTGSLFRVALPLPEVAEHEDDGETGHTEDYGLEGIHVLVIDDDRIQLDVTRRMLMRYKVRCGCCRTVQELMAALRERKYDLLLSDIQMPDMDGYKILDLLRSSNMENARMIPVLAVTACADDEEYYISCGFAGSLRKPFPMDELISAVSRLAVKTGKKEPDFSFILSGEENKGGMLDIFIQETEESIHTLENALCRRDRDAIRKVLHKNLPLWETVRMDFPMARLRYLVTHTAAVWEEEQYLEIGEIIHAAERLTESARKIRERPDEDHTDYRG